MRMVRRMGGPRVPRKTRVFCLCCSNVKSALSQPSTRHAPPAPGRGTTHRHGPQDSTAAAASMLASALPGSLLPGSVLAGSVWLTLLTFTGGMSQ